MTEQERKSLARREIFGELDPFREFFGSPRHMSRLLDRPWGENAGVTNWAPSMDISETEDGYAVTLELAGAQKDDISIECHENVLTIKGEKKSEREESDEHRHYTERVFGSFTRSLRLPVDVSDQVKAAFKDGVLTVEIPKVEAAKPRIVNIDS